MLVCVDEKMTVTEEMISAAQQQLPGVWNRERVRRALTAALDAAPSRDVPVPLTLTVHLQVDRQQLRAAALTAVDQARAALPVDRGGILDLAELRLTVADGPQPALTTRTPDLNPALAGPIEPGSLAEFARRVGVARSTVTGWTKSRDTNGIPAPIHGDIYDLRALTAWHHARKAR